MKPTEDLAVDYANMISRTFGDGWVEEMAINETDNATTVFKKLMLFNIKMANRIDRLEAESEQLWDVIYPNG